MSILITHASGEWKVPDITALRDRLCTLRYPKATIDNLVARYLIEGSAGADELADDVMICAV